MIDWKDTTFDYGKGKIKISGATIGDAYKIILKYAKKRSKIHYSVIINELKRLGHTKISRRTIGSIVGDVSIQISRVTDPSIYPSSIVVRKDHDTPGEGFWGVDSGKSPPSDVKTKQQKIKLQEYQKNVFDWASEL